MISWKCSHCLWKQFSKLSQSMASANRSMSGSDNITKILVVGLGNSDMPKTRHSVGMRLADQIADTLDIRWSRDKAMNGWWAERTLQAVSSEDSSYFRELQMIVLKPKVSMNINGKSVAATVKHFGVDPNFVYLLHDELDKPWGKFSIKEGGSARGHNGVRSVIASLRVDTFPRVRIGIDRPASRTQVVDYVLADMTKEEVRTFTDCSQDIISLLFSHMEKKCLLPRRFIERTLNDNSNLLSKES